MSISLDAPNPHFAVRPDWLALHHEPILEPDLPIIDAHHHLWDRPEHRYFFLDCLKDLQSGHNIHETVYVECGAMYRSDGPPELRSVGEVEFANGAAAMGASGVYGNVRVCAAIVAYGDLLLGSRLAPVLEQYLNVSGRRVRGVRQISAWHSDPAARGSLANPPPDLLNRPIFREGLSTLARFGMSFDAYMYHTQLLDLVPIAEHAQDVPVILNHTGGAIGIGPYSGRRDEVFSRWRAGILALAKVPNVNIKLGGLGMRVFGFDFGERPIPPRRTSLQVRGALISKLVLRPLDRTAACSKAISPSIRALAAMPSCGTASNASLLERRDMRKIPCSTEPRAGFIA